MALLYPSPTVYPDTGLLPGGIPDVARPGHIRFQLTRQWVEEGNIAQVVAYVLDEDSQPKTGQIVTATCRHENGTQIVPLVGLDDDNVDVAVRFDPTLTGEYRVRVIVAGPVIQAAAEASVVVLPSHVLNPSANA